MTARPDWMRRRLQERLVLAQAWAGLVLADLALRVLPPRWILPRAAGRGARRRPRGGPSVRRIVALVDAAERRVPVPVTCLTRALVLGWILRRRGIPTTLRIGVRRRDGRLTAHAWLESSAPGDLGLPDAAEHVPLRALAGGRAAGR